MKTIMILILAAILPSIGQASTNDSLQELSGTLVKAGGKAMKPYYLEVFMANGPAQRILLSGDVLKNVNTPMNVKVRGRIMTEFRDSVPPQPHPAGWLIWMNVEEVIPDQGPPPDKK